MALTKDDLVIGNTVYLMKTINNLMTQRKLTMIDSEGNQWSRYDKPRWTFKVIPMIICGTIVSVVTGKVDEHQPTRTTQYHMELGDGEITYFYEYQLIEDQTGYEHDGVYASADEAEAAGQTFCVNRNDM